MLSGDHQGMEQKTNMDHVKGMFVDKMKSLSEVRSSNSSTVETISTAAPNKVMEMLQADGWAIPSRSNFRFSFEQKEILYKLFMDGEKTGNKVSPDSAASIIRERLTVKDYVTTQQIRSLFSRWSKQLRENTLAAPHRKANARDDCTNKDSSSEDEDEDEDGNHEDLDANDEESLHYHDELSNVVAEACPEWELNDWVVVKYNSKMFPGQVIGVEEACFVVDCMHECFSSRNCFRWPHPRDNSTCIVSVKSFVESNNQRSQRTIVEE